MCKTNTKKKIAFLVAVLLAVAMFAGEASAYTAPYKLIVFTDKQVYLDYAYLWTDPPTIDTTRGTDTYRSFTQQPNLFVVLLDSDGNIVKGIPASNITAALRDAERWNHSGPGLASYPFYTVISTGGTYYNNVSFPVFTDNDGDGIFNSSNTNVVRTLSLTPTPPLTDHLNISINVTLNYNGTAYKTNVSVTFGNMGCRHNKLIGDAHGAGNHDNTVCTVCHWGYQYALGAHGQNNTIMYNDPERWKGVPSGVADSATWDYKLGILKTGGNQTTWDNSNASFCLLCHGGTTTATYVIGNVLAITTGSATGDQNSDGIADNKRPSCSWYQGPRNGTGGYPVCHGPQQGFDGSTKITGASLNKTDWKGWSQKPGQSKSHNHSTAPKTNGTPCELCHAGGGAPGTGTGGLHQVAGLPNTTTDYSNINDQCVACHNISDGWLDITSNGGTAKNHSKSQCANCHIENNKLDSHLVPVGAYGGKWCLDCHNLTGKAPINMKVDPAIVNKSNQNYIHYKLNENSDAPNSSRICWACHTNDSVVIGGKVDSSSLPEAEHPGGFDTPRSCTKCHNNTSSYNFSAPQNAKHTWYAPDMKTPAVTYCVNCHAQDEELNAWNEAVFPPKTANESAAHYGKNRTSFFGPKIGTREYCGYCHQNESTVFGPFANPDNEVRSDHASNLTTTPGCGNNLCHKEGRIHDDTLVVPKYNESNIASTCSACHSTTNYSAHNSTLTCWDCHMGNVSNTTATWIHPIQFIQYNGNFTGAKLTSATCYDCHKSTSVDNTTQNLSGKKAPKVYGQSHSNDPSNGTKWGDYWKYTPTTYQFASFIVGSGTINPAYPFDNIKVPSNDYMELIENQTGSSNDPVTFPYTKAEREIQGPPVPNWTSSTAITSNAPTIKAEQDATKGNPAGSLKASITTQSNKAGAGNVTWNYSFNYNPDTGQYAYTTISVQYNITVAGATAQNVYLRLVKPSGTVVTLANASSSVTTAWLTLANNSFGTALDLSGTYKIQLYTELNGASGTKTYTVNYDNILLRFQEKVWNRYDIVINTTNVPVNGSSKLGLSYQVHNENTSLMIYNKTSGAYETLDYLNSGVFFDYVKDIKSTHHINSSDGITGNVSVRFVDTDQSDTDAVSDKLHIRYLYVYTDRGLQYPCEQCHSPNKHYLNPSIGSPDTFKGNNKYNSTNLTNSTWCQQCHWDKASNYSGMIKEFNVTRNPPENIPPEITGNKTYGNMTTSKDGKTAYVNHSGNAYSDMNDSGCFACHGKAGDTTTSQFVHNVQVGESGNRKCITCHNATTTKFKKIDVEAVRRGMHAGLKNASANVSNTSNPIELACWACHGDGTYNSSDQHRNANAWTCDKCHTNTTGKLSYGSAAKVYEHIPPGFITPEANITANSTATWSCADCHNNSINATALINDNEADPITARTGHYGLNRTGGKLMYDYSTPPKGNSEDCIYCHKGNSANMTKWGVNTSSTKNLSNKLSPTDHTTFGNSDCAGCHNYTNTSSFTFHVEEINEGAGASGPNCKNCHDIGKSATGKLVNFSAMNETNAIHKSLNSGAVTALDAENKKCWACHGGGSEPSGHPSNYKTPYNCTDCHNASGTQSGKYPGWNVTEHVKAGTVSGTELFTPLAANCYTCHNKSEMMVSAYDPDSGTGAVYGGANGGNNSTSHYGLKRNLGSGDAYCNYCHSNATSVFPYVNQHNKSIFEHTTNTTADITNTTLTCSNSICHSTGRIHNATLVKPSQNAWTSGQKDYCAPCHNSTGSATKKVYNQWHDPANASDNITNCNYCHDSGSLGSTTLSYTLNVHSDNLTYPAGNTTCVACHNASSNYVKSRRILTHFPGASKDKGNTSLSARTCEACHGIAGQSMHAQGLVKKPAYGCNACHNSTASGPYWANQSFNSYIDTTSHDNKSTSNLTNCEWCHNSSSAKAPFHFTLYANGSAANPGWGGWQAGTLVNCTNCHDSSYSNQAPFYAPAKPHPGTGNNTDECYSCHTNVTTYTAAPLAIHTVIQAPGNANCTKCHDIGGAASKEVDVAAMNRSDSIHLNLNSGASSSNATDPYKNDSKRCWACHGDGTDKNEHNQTRYKNPYKCEDCHSAGGSQSGRYPSFNVTEHFAGGVDIKTQNASNCYSCHNKGEMLQGHNDTDVLSSNASVGHYGKKRGTDIDMRSGANTTCTYCHQNSTTAFESAMLKSSNKSIFEHTDTGAKNTTGRSCTDGNCHAQGFIHNATLTKPSVQVWTSGKQDYCAPCHKAGNASATKYVYGHNSSNISVLTTDCGYCHNASSQGQTGTGALKIHTSTLTNKSTANTTCLSCHQDAIYVTNQRVVNTHYPGAPSGKANTSLDSFTCEACHGNMASNKMHNASLNIPSDRCNNCHNGTTAGGYKATKIPYVNATKHDNSSHNATNTINCDWCHNNSNAAQKFHFTQYPNGSVQAPGWSGWVNGTNANCTNCHDTYKDASPFYAEPIWHKGSYGTTLDNCYQCHTNVSSSLSSYAPIALHNVTKAIDWSYCNNCHSNNYGGAPIVDNASLASSMHYNLNGSTPSNTEPACKACHGGNATTHKNASANNCTYCHVSPLKYTTKNVSRHIPYPYTTDVNTSRYQKVFCSDCHNNSLRTYSDPTPYSSNATTAHYGMNKTAGKLMYNNTGNSEDCVYCHRNNSNMAAWGILNTSNANLSKKGGTHATAANSDCYTCHVNSTSTPVNFHVEDMSAGSGGGPDCKACHNIGGMAQGKQVNFSAMNDSLAIHKNLNSGASAVVDAENKKCWACHTSNGTAPPAGDHSFVNKYKTPYNCTDCHISKSGQNFNYTPNNTLLNVTQHKADSVNGTTIFTPSAADCYSCHNKSEMMIQALDPDNGTGAVYGGLHGGNDSASHYGLKRSLGSGDNYCYYCHSNASSIFPFGNAHNKAIFEHTSNNTADIRNTTTLECIDCHTSDLQSYRIHNSTLKTPSVSAWTAGKEDRCAPCHKTTGSGSSLKVNNTYHNTTSGSITECGYCHNSEAMQIGAPQNIHSDNLTAGGNSTYNNCYNCHQNGFASKVINEHTNSTTANITNASMTCDKSGCHNSNKTHSSALVKPFVTNWTTGGSDYCAPCHNSSDSTTNATKKIYNKGHDPANRTDDNITSCGNCHNASTPGAVPASFKLHDPSLTNLSGSNASTCQGCHNVTTAYVGIAKQILSHMPNASQYRGNTSTSSYSCENCHNMTGKPSMHSAGMDRSNGTCETCHFNGTSPFSSTQKNITQLAGGMINHSYTGTANTTCKMCHYNSSRAKFHISKYASGDIADPQDSNGNPTFENRSTWNAADINNRGILVDCRDCHEKYNDTAPFFAPYFEAINSPIAPQQQEHVNKGYTLKNCYICHTNETNSLSGDTIIKPAGLHNVSIEPLTGGPNCKKCHDIASPNRTEVSSLWVNFTAFNSTDSKHKNLTNATAWGGSSAFTLIDTACWACHQSDGKQPERHTDLKDNTSLTGGSKAYRCADCHTVGGIVSSYQLQLYQKATKVYQHYPGSVFLGTKTHSTNFTKGSCQVCHNNSIVYNNITFQLNATVSHYAGNKSYGLYDSLSSNSCGYCHNSSTVTYGVPTQISGTNHNMGGACQALCHNPNYKNSTSVNPVILHNASVGIYMNCYTAGGDGGCHVLKVR